MPARASTPTPSPPPPSRQSAPTSPSSPRKNDLQKEVVRPKPMSMGNEIEEKESPFVLMLREYGQRCLDFLAYAASFTWVSKLPDWAQPIAWGLLVSIPAVFLMIIAVNLLK